MNEGENDDDPLFIRVHCLPSNHSVLCCTISHSLISFAFHRLSHTIIFSHFISDQFFTSLQHVISLSPDMWFSTVSVCLSFSLRECVRFNPFRLFIFTFTFFYAIVIGFYALYATSEGKISIHLPLSFSLDFDLASQCGAACVPREHLQKLYWTHKRNKGVI